MSARSIPSADDLRNLYPSSIVKRLGPRIVDSAAGKPILDVACGGGRNAILLAYLGGDVICIDKDLTKLEAKCSRLQAGPFGEAIRRIRRIHLDLTNDQWPFDPEIVGGLVNIHFLHPPLFPAFRDCLQWGGSLLIQTVPGHGGNYVELPRAGALRQEFEQSISLEIYKEQKAGPEEVDAVTVQLFGRRVH